MLPVTSSSGNQTAFSRMNRNYVWLVIQRSQKHQQPTRNQAAHSTITLHSCARRHECVLCNSEGAMNQHPRGGVGEGRAAPAKKKNNKWPIGAMLLAACKEVSSLLVHVQSPGTFFRVRDNFGLSDRIRVSL